MRFHIVLALLAVAPLLALATPESDTGPRVVKVEYLPRFILYETYRFNFVQVSITYDAPLYVRSNRCPEGVEAPCLVGLRDIPIKNWEDLLVQVASVSCDGRPFLEEEEPDCSTIFEYDQCEQSAFCRADSESMQCVHECDGPCPIIALPPRQRDPISTVFAVDGGLQDMLRSVVIDNNRLVFLFFQTGEDLSSGQTMNFGDNPTEDWRSGSCVVSINPDKIVGADEGEIEQPSDSSVYREVDPVCDQTRLSEQMIKLNEYLDALKGVSDMDGMKRARTRIMTVIASDSWFGCESKIRDAIIEGTQLVTRTTKDCVVPEGTLDWEVDPCCNAELQNTVCCAAREVSANVTALIDVDAEYVSLQCGNRGTVAGLEAVLQAMNSYVAHQVAVNNANTGCNAVLVRDLGGSLEDGGSLWNSFTSFMDDCRDAIFGEGYSGQGKECTTNSDCYTECVIEDGASGSSSSTGRCAIPYGNPAPYLRACYIATMDKDIKARLLRVWGVYNVSDEAAFAAAFTNRTSTNQCNGPSGWLYNGGWFRNRTNGGGGSCPTCPNGGTGTGPNEGGDAPQAFHGVRAVPLEARVTKRSGARSRREGESRFGRVAPSRLTDYTVLDHQTAHRLARRAAHQADIFTAKAKRQLRDEAHTSLKKLARPATRSLEGSLQQAVTLAKAAQLLGEGSATNPYEDNARYNMEPCWGSSERDMLDNGCVWLEGDAEGCEAEEQCNNGNPWADEEQCTVDRLNNGGFFCGQCWGGNSCWERSRLPICALNDWNFGGGRRGSGWEEAQCEAADGEVVRPNEWDPEDKVCSVSTGTITQCFTACTSNTGPQPGPRYGCVNRTMDDETCSSQQNEWGWSFAGMNWMYQGPGQAPLRVCQAWVGTAEQCTFPHFHWEQLQEESDWTKADRCQRNYCFNKAVDTANECWALNDNDADGYWFHWDDSLANNEGACTTYINEWGRSWEELQEECESVGEGWTWYQGRYYQAGAVYTEELCSTGVCEFDDRLSEEECAGIHFCTRSCQGCGASWRSVQNSVCFHANQSLCSEQDGANWDDERSKCFISNKDAASCSAAETGGTYVSCLDFSDEECTSNDYQDLLECDITWRQCQDADECEAQGECSDWNLQDWSNYQWNQEADPVCVFPKIMNQWGWLDCYANGNKGGGQGGPGGEGDGGDSDGAGSDRPENLTPSENGCVATNSDVSSEEDCTGRGGLWMSRAKSQAECTTGAGRVGCCEPGKDCRWQLTNKNATECAACGGSPRPFFGWNGGVWRSGRVVSLDWKERARSPINTWAPTVSEALIRRFIDMAVSSRIAEAYRTEALCRFGPVRSLMKTVACECGVNLNEECSSTAQEAADLGESDVFCGQEKSIAVSGYEVRLGSDSVRTCDQAASVQLSSQFAAPKQGDAGVTNGRRIRRRLLGLAEDAACYATVKNSHNAVIGQLRGNCLVFTASGQVEDVEICMPVKPSIPYDSSAYPDIAYARVTKDGSNNNVYTAHSGGDIYDAGDALCITVSESGTYCPVSVKNGWAALNSASVATCGQSSALQGVIQTQAALLSTATQLAFITHPASGVAAGTTMGTAPVVEFRDENGQRVTSAQGSITLSIKSGTGTVGASISGTVRVVAVNGRATFDDIAISKSGSGYKLRATSSSLTAGDSNSFSVAAGAPAGVLFTTQPAGAVATQSFLAQPVVAIVDASGTVVPTAVNTVTLAGFDSSDSSASVSGTVSRAAVNGYATFTGLSMASQGLGYYLTASASGLSPDTSEEFDVVASSGVAVKLEFQDALTNSDVSTALDTQPVILVKDASDAVVTTALTSVTISIKSGTGVSGAVLSGTKTVAAVNGVVTYSGLSINMAGSGYRLRATASGLVAAQSNTFTVNGPSQLVFHTQPDTSSAGSTFTTAPVVRIVDVDGALMNSRTDYIQLSIKANTGNSGTLSGTVRRQASAGQVTFPNLQIDNAGSGYVLVATTDDGVTGESDPFTISGDDDDDDDDSPAPAASYAMALICVGAGIFVALLL